VDSVDYVCYVYVVTNATKRTSVDTSLPLRRGERAYVEMRELIVSGELPPRSVVKEADMVRRLGISRISSSGSMSVTS
jgi:DNA-binding GntR family transcriptional regulator